MKYLLLIICSSLLFLFYSHPASSGPEKMTDEQMTEVKVQKGIKNLDANDSTSNEKKILEGLVAPVPGTELDFKNTPNPDMTQIELDNLNNQVHEQNIQEQFSEHLFDQVIENSNQ